MNETRLYDAFDDCLGRALAGEPVQSCLRAYPDLAADLQPMLDDALAAYHASRVPHHAQMRSRARFLGAAAGLRSRPRPAPWLGLLGKAFSTLVAVAAGFALGTAGLYYTSASTLPGDSLYGVKRAFESARLQLASDPHERFALENDYNALREAELQAVLAEDRFVVVTFGGVLTGREGSQWQVGGFNLEVTDQTEIVGDPRPGYYVSVVAENRDGVLVALELRAEESEIIGTLDRSGSGWAIAGTSFSVGAETQVTGTLVPGVTAAARIRTLHTGERVAVSIITLEPTATPTQTSLPAPSSTPSPVPTRTLPPTRLPRPTLAPPTLAPTAAPAQPTPAPTLLPADDNGNANEGGDDDNGNANQGGGDDDGNSNDDGNDNADDDDGDDNSGSGGGNSGRGGGDDDDDDDNSGSGGGDDD
jgi:hypothetical protein